MRAVLERDFLVEASRTRAFVFRTLVGAVIGAVVYALLYDRRMLLQESPDIAARQVFGIGGCALLALLVLLTPTAVVGAVLDERTRETLSLVLAAPVGPAAFAGAKLAARSLAVLTWAMAALVPLFLITLLGGVGWDQIGDLLALGAGIVIDLAAWGLWISTVSRNLSTASVLAYLLPLARWAGMAGLLIATLHWYAIPGGPAGRHPDTWGAPGVRAWFHAAALTTPIPAALRLSDSEGYDHRVRAVLAEGTGTNTAAGASGGASVVFLRGPVVYWKGPNNQLPVPATVSWNNSVPRFNRGSVVITRMRRFVASPATPPSPPPLPLLLRHPALLYLVVALLTALAALRLSARRLAREAEPPASRFLRFLRRRKLLGAPGDGANPVAWKEERLLNAAASRPLYYTALAVFVAAELLLLAASGNVLDRGQVMRAGLFLAAGHVGLLCLAAVVAGAASMAHERAFGTLDLLRASPLSAFEILDGKVKGLLRGLGLVGLLPLLHLLLLACGGHLDPISATVGLVLEALVVLAWCGVGILCGIGAPGMGVAVRRGVLAYGTFILGLPLAGLFLGWLLDSPQLSAALAAGSPPAQFYFTLDGCTLLFNETWIQAYSWEVGRLGQGHVIGWSIAWLGVTAAWAFLGRRLLPRLLARRFERERVEG